jgi:aminomethyltransferase
MKAHDETMMLRTPFHSRVAEACEINQWDDWKGYTTPRAYTEVEQEYFAVRSSTGVFDLSPMTKYRITGADAERYLNRVMTRDVSKLKPGRVGYTIWCNDAGQVMDDGTLFHFGAGDYRLCSYTRVMDWLQWSSLGLDVSIEDETADVAALAVQGPTSCAVLKAMGFIGIEELKPFGLTHHAFENTELMISRTGFTGDLGYELWIELGKAELLWDRLFTAGANLGIHPIGNDALEMLRIEAGFLQAGVDFVPAEETVREGRSRSPFELGLGWLVDLDKGLFNGRRALIEEQRNGSRYGFVFLDVQGNKPAQHSFILKGKREIGSVTSAAWCPTAKSNIAFAQVESQYGRPGEELIAEIYYQRELIWTRLLAKCRVIERPVFSSPKRRQTPAPDF